MHCSCNKNQPLSVHYQNIILRRSSMLQTLIKIYIEFCTLNSGVSVWHCVLSCWPLTRVGYQKLSPNFKRSKLTLEDFSEVYYFEYSRYLSLVRIFYTWSFVLTRSGLMLTKIYLIYNRKAPDSSSVHVESNSGGASWDFYTHYTIFQQS